MTSSLRAAQVVDAAGNCGLRQDARGRLERRRGDERVGRERSFGDAEEEREGLGSFLHRDASALRSSLVTH